MPEVYVEKNQCCQGSTNNNVSERQYFNYLRNNSSDIYGAMTWNIQQANIGNQQPSKRETNFNRTQDKKVTFNETKDTLSKGRSVGKEKSPSKNVIHQTHKRSQSVRKSRLQKNVEEEQQKQQQNRQKVQNYIADLKPYSRNLSNTKFQQYFGKAAPECYGRANINEPIGGIIYGNHLKTFNMNPHSFTNKPQNYQTHTTAINYGKRTKLNEEGKWKRLERQLSKKLGLKDKNQTLKEGKEIVYVDVDDNNMYDVMRENNEFKKAHFDEIRQQQLQYKKDKHQQYLDDINEFYAKKQEAIANQAEKRRQERQRREENRDEDYDETARLNQQMVFKYHDEKGNVRYAGDRHAITCFVDLNFPQNDAIYTQELKSRMPISPTKVKNKDKNIDEIRRGNYEKSKEQIYPSHYLLRNCEEPEVLKMLSEKAGVKLTGSKVNNNKQVKMTAKNPRTNKTFMSTQATKQQEQRKFEDDSQIMMRNEEQRDMTKSQILNRAWDNPQMVEQIQNNRVQTCCAGDHLPHNQKNPQCYKNISQKVNRIPFAG